MYRKFIYTGLTAASLLVGCSDDSADGTEDAAGGAGGADVGSGTGGTTSGAGGGVVIDELSVSGTVLGFDDATLSVSATISVTGLNPLPTINVTGAEFEVSGVAPFSAFQILAGAAPDFRNTYNVATEVTDMDVTGLQARVVSETFLGELDTEFGITPGSGTGTILGRVLGEDGMPRSGIEASAFELNGAAPPRSPFFLDANGDPDKDLTETSTSGWVVFYDVPPGLTEFAAAGGSGYTVVAAASPVATNIVTLADLNVTDGELLLPTDVSFEQHVVPIFAKRGCETCHSGNSIGADLGNLALNGGANKIHRELTEETSPTHDVVRVNLVAPNESLVLTMPSFETPPDVHPNVTFTNTADEDYLTILGWITEGAKDN